MAQHEQTTRDFGGDDLLRLERLVAHRELQLLRAGARSRLRPAERMRYLATRQRKLDEARGALERARRRCAHG